MLRSLAVRCAVVEAAVALSPQHALRGLPAAIAAQCLHQLILCAQGAASRSAHHHEQ